MSYFDIEALSYSSLRALSVGPAYFKYQQEQDSEEKDHLIIGSAVDIMLTENNKFWEYYYLEFEEFDSELPQPQMLKFIDYLVHNENCGEITGNCYEEAYEYAGINKKKLETIISEFKDKYQPYYQYLIKKNIYNVNNKDKQLLTNNQYKIVDSIVNSLRNNQFTKKYFEEYFESSKERFTQLEIYWELKDLKCKSKLDLVFVNHNTKEIQPMDLKTTGNSVFSFDSSSLRWRYDLQAAWYSMALYWLINYSNDEYWSKLKSYKLLNFKFIVESTKNPGTPLIYSCSDKFLNMATSGFRKDGKWYKGIEELVEDYKWYVDKNSWSYNREIIENNGEIELRYD